MKRIRSPKYVSIERAELERINSRLEVCVIALALLRDGIVCPKDKDARVFAKDTLAVLPIYGGRRHG